MYFSNELQGIVQKPVNLTPLTKFLNPATIIPIAAISTVVFTAVTTIKRLKSKNNKLQKDNEIIEGAFEDYIYETEYKNDDDSETEPYEQPLKLTVEPTVEKPLLTVENMDDEALQKEMIRQTMSELGKRSAAARRKKRET